MAGVQTDMLNSNSLATTVSSTGAEPLLTFGPPAHVFLVLVISIVTYCMMVLRVDAVCYLSSVIPAAIISSDIAIGMTMMLLLLLLSLLLHTTWMADLAISIPC